MRDYLGTNNSPGLPLKVLPTHPPISAIRDAPLTKKREPIIHHAQHILLQHLTRLLSLYCLRFLFSHYFPHVAYLPAQLSSYPRRALASSSDCKLKTSCRCFRIDARYRSVCEAASTTTEPCWVGLPRRQRLNEELLRRGQWKGKEKRSARNGEEGHKGIESAYHLRTITGQNLGKEMGQAFLFSILVSFSTSSFFHILSYLQAVQSPLLIPSQQKLIQLRSEPCQASTVSLFSIGMADHQPSTAGQEPESAVSISGMQSTYQLTPQLDCQAGRQLPPRETIYEFTRRHKTLSNPVDDKRDQINGIAGSTLLLHTDRGRKEQ